jgi:hypothetical protein
VSNLFLAVTNQPSLLPAETSIERARNPVSALLWFPPVAAAGLPVLPTEFVKFDSANLFQCHKGGEIRFNFPLNQLMAACKRIGYPVLLRPDLAGTKCALPEPFMVDNREHMVKCLLESLSGPRDKDMRAIMVRRYLPIEPTFVTRLGGIGREWRLFAGECRRRCHHFYWEEKHKDSQFASYCNDAGKDVRKAEREIDPQQKAVLYKMAARAAKAIGYGAWSVDFGRDVNGKWWLMDMAANLCSRHQYPYGYFETPALKG